LPDLKPFYRRFSKMPLVSISAAQLKPLPHANFVATIHHGIPADLHRPAFEPGSYLAFLGRVSPEKRPDRAIRIAQRVGIPLKIAAKVDKVDEAYFRSEILPLIDGHAIEFLGEINDEEETSFLRDAAALLFPIDWPEPFGLVMIEAMACGTPVLAFRCGSVPEIVEDGVTGKVVESAEWLCGRRQGNRDDAMNKTRAERTSANDLTQIQENASELARSVGDVVGKFIQEQPYTATLIALGVGWLLGRTHRPL
jgi:glycosyltransferase involved in cell wall biosynthesis